MYSLIIYVDIPNSLTKEQSGKLRDWMHTRTAKHKPKNVLFMLNNTNQSSRIASYCSSVGWATLISYPSVERFSDEDLMRFYIFMCDEVLVVGSRPERFYDIVRLTNKKMVLLDNH
jgi:hypothetical protein